MTLKRQISSHLNGTGETLLATDFCASVGSDLGKNVSIWVRLGSIEFLGETVFADRFLTETIFPTDLWQ